jgi:hypothetical protein
LLDLIANFSKKNDNQFNDELIYGIRHNDEMAKHIDEACKAIVQLIPEYVKYNGYHYQNTRSKMLDLNKDDSGVKAGNKDEIRINIANTYAKEAIFEFECSFGGQVVKQSFAIWIPMLWDNAHFYIRGNKYSCPLQVIDAITFTKKNVLVLKTITRAIKYEREKAVITDIYGNKYSTSKIMIFSTSKKAIPVVLYFFAYYGFFRTLEYFGADKFIDIYSGDLASGIPKDKYIFKFGTVYLGVDKKEFNENLVLRQFVATILDTQKRTMDMNYIRDPVRWTSLLGETLSIQKSLEKGVALLKTFMNSLDFHTRNIIKELVPGTERNNIFAVTRWIFCNYATLTCKDDGLQNKRIRLGEYLISPFIKVFTEKIYRFINTPKSIKTLDGLLDVFKIKSTIILNAIIGKISPEKTGMTIAKFSSESNDDALVNTLLMITKTGPGSPSEKSKRVSIALRQFPIDYLGNINLIEGQSAGAPGMSHYICPINNTFNLNKKIFDIDPILIKK